MRPTVMEVNLDNFKYNINSIKKYIGNDVLLMPVIKANGYGTYINLNAIIDEFKIVCVALVDEGIILREHGYTGDILVINQPDISEIDEIFKYKLIVGLSDENFLDAMVKFDDKFRVHIEVDTGMARTGIRNMNLVNKLKNCPSISVEGIYSHLSSADDDVEFTNNQIKLFNDYVENIKTVFSDIKYIHLAASNGIVNYPNSHYNAVRVGIIMYGYESFEGCSQKIDLKPICKLKSKITYLKEVNEGTPISYNHSFITNRPSIIATVPIGYADGLRRDLSNKGHVVVNGKLCPIVGKVCMDSIMVDVTDCECKMDDDVYIWDNDLIKVDDIAKECNTINYEIICTVSSRVPRVFIR